MGNENKTVLVCGGRDYDDIDKVRKALTILRPGDVVVHGGAKGADSLADVVAKEMGILTIPYYANWNAYGRRAGLMRNHRMLSESSPDLVVAFPGGRGTAHMVQIAREAGVKVTLVENRDEERKQFIDKIERLEKENEELRNAMNELKLRFTHK